MKKIDAVEKQVRYESSPDIHEDAPQSWRIPEQRHFGGIELGTVCSAGLLRRHHPGSVMKYPGRYARHCRRLGVQGHKRLAVAGEAAVATVDPINPQAQYKWVEDVPLAAYDAALVCTPDETKLDLLSYLVSHRKHLLVEKPLFADAPANPAGWKSWRRRIARSATPPITIASSRISCA